MFFKTFSPPLEILEEYNQAPPNKRDYSKKDGVLVAIAVLTKVSEMFPSLEIIFFFF
jgi:hypothetical protein